MSAVPLFIEKQQAVEGGTDGVQAGKGDAAGFELVDPGRIQDMLEMLDDRRYKMFSLSH